MQVDGFSTCRASWLHGSAAMKDRATVSGAHSCLSQSEEHLDLVVLLQALCGFHGGPDEAASSQKILCMSRERAQQ